MMKIEIFDIGDHVEYDLCSKDFTNSDAMDLSEPEQVTKAVSVPKLSGLVLDLDNETYHQHESISKTGLDLIARSPAHYQYCERKETPAFKKGSLAHCAILEPDFLDSRYHPLTEKLDLRTKIGKEKLAEATELGNRRIVVTAEEWVMARGVRDAVLNHKTAKHLLGGGISEASVFSTLSDCDVRCRPDHLHIDSGICVDLKSCDDASMFEHSIRKYRYYVQSPFYTHTLQSEGIEIDNFIFVAIEKSRPWGIQIYELGYDSFELGRREYIRCLDIYKRCMDTGEWPGYETGIKIYDLPNYMLKDL